MRVKLHGTRGSHPTPIDENNYYGGNTSCVEVIEGSERLILDAGTGILGIKPDEHYRSRRIDLLLTHLHTDHIQGLGFFTPLFDPEKEIHIWGPGGSKESLFARLNRFLSPPLFPKPLRDVSCELIVHEVTNTSFQIGSFNINSAFVLHPGPTIGFRIQCGQSTMAYIPDHEIIIGRFSRVAGNDWMSGYDIAKDVDLLIHDSQYTLEQYKNRLGWGHCPIDHAVLFAERCRAKHLVLFHHDPSHTDRINTKIFTEFMAEHKPSMKVELAVQGKELNVGQFVNH